jgi:hypothetical protein
MSVTHLAIYYNCDICVLVFNINRKENNDE